MQEFYAVFLDIDGTVYCDGDIVPENRVAIQKAQAAGHKIYLNTARSLADINSRILSVCPDGIVAGIGCTVIAEGQKILSESIPLPELADIFDWMTRDGYEVFLEGESKLVRNALYDGHGTLVRDGAELLRQYADNDFAKMFIPHVLPEKWQTELAERYQFFQHTRYAEFSKKGHNKATGMQCVLDFYGLDRAHCIAMGDSLNDLDMLRHAGMSVAMGDSSEDVRKTCTMISRNARDGGVAEALYTILRIPSELSIK